MNRGDIFLLLAAFLSFVFSVSLWFLGLREEGFFVGLWVPSIHSLGTLMLVQTDGPTRRELELLS